MNKIAIVLIAILTLTWSCEDSNIKNGDNQGAEEVTFDTAMFLNDIAKVEAEINIDMPEKATFQKAITLFKDYAIIFPKGENTADYLLRASDFSHHLGQNSKAVELLDKVIADYPNYDKLSNAMYHRADYLDFYLKDTVLAKQYYLEYIEKFPNTAFASNAQTRIDQHFMSMDELIEMFTKQQ